MSKIVIVDDDTNIRTLCYKLLSREGHDVVAFPRGHELFSYLQSEKPDLVLMDVNIPGEEGLSLLKSMPNANNEKIPTIIYSGIVTPELELAAYEAGASEVVRKEEGPDELKRKVNKVLKAMSKPKDETPEELETILVVDDEENIRKLLCEFLEYKGYRVVVAGSGEEALKVFDAEKPRMVLLDITMPGMDGLMTLKQLKERNPNVGVVMATGIQDEFTAREAIRLGAYDYVLKPFDLKYLELVVLTRLIIASDANSS